jgi:hypothetical protein
MFYGIKDKLKRWKYDFQVRDVLRTPPARISAQSSAVILSQLQHKDLRMFLLACKSFMLQVPIAHVYILNDGTLTANDKAIILEHIPQSTFLALEDFRSRICPTGSCWERLLGIAELVKDHYVIQLDSDTLAVGDISEISNNIENNIAFTLGTWDNQVIQSMRECCEATQAKVAGANPHVQYVAETNFDKLKQYGSLRYVKGCAGFIGVPKGSFTRNFVETISAEMEAAIGARWHEWGTEQVMSNIVVANINGATVLPHPKYSSCENLKIDRPSFIHFIGYCRFDEGIYAKLGRQLIKKLQN